MLLRFPTIHDVVYHERDGARPESVQGLQQQQRPLPSQG